MNDISFEQWQQQGFDKHSVVADPLFVEVTKPQLGLRPNSPAYRLSFKPIDVSKVGLGKDYPSHIEK
ncbi:MAG: hypothetical protein ACYTF1_18135 [Planctomycetota bacterium]